MGINTPIGLDDAEVFVCRASGEGSHNFRICTNEAQVFEFYKEMWGEDHGGGIQSAIDNFRDPDNWSNQGTAYSCELYCSTFEVWKVDDRELNTQRSESGAGIPEGWKLVPLDSASEPIELLRAIQVWLSANQISRPLDWECRVDALLRSTDSAGVPK